MPGRVEAIHVAARHGAPMEQKASVQVVADFGLEGDRSARRGSNGQVTIVSLEELREAEALLGSRIASGSTRRNITISGVPLSRRRGDRLRLGPVLLEIRGDAAPCELMNEVIAPGAREALADRSGVRARVVEAGVLSVGDAAFVEMPHQVASAREVSE